MAVLITGSAGFIGHHLVRKLTQVEPAVVCMYRHRLPEPHERVMPFFSDLRSAELLAAPLRGVDTVVHLAWSDSFVGPQEDVCAAHDVHNVFTPNLSALRNLMHGMERAGTPRLIFLSARGARRNARVAFLKEKYLAEHHLLNSAIKEKVIVRCPLTWSGAGRHDRLVKTFLRLMRFPGLCFLPDVRQQVSLAHVNNIAAQLAELCQQPVQTQSLIITPSTQVAYSVHELCKLISTAVLSRPKLPIGGVLGNAMLPFCEDAHAPKVKQMLALTE